MRHYLKITTFLLTTNFLLVVLVGQIIPKPAFANITLQSAIDSAYQNNEEIFSLADSISKIHADLLSNTSTQISADGATYFGEY